MVNGGPPSSPSSPSVPSDFYELTTTTDDDRRRNETERPMTTDGSLSTSKHVDIRFTRALRIPLLKKRDPESPKFLNDFQYTFLRLSKTNQTKAEQTATGKSRQGLTRAREQTKARQSKPEQTRARQSRPEPGRADESRPEQGRADQTVALPPSPLPSLPLRAMDI